MPHEITPEEIRAVKDVGELQIASASNGLKSKRLVWYAATGNYAVITGSGTIERETTSTVDAAIAYNKIDI